MTKPWVLCADVHAHNWSAFSSVDADGKNTRLVGLLGELTRAARMVDGGKMVIAGDMFHVRGQIAPSVLNPTRDALHDIVNDRDGRLGTGCYILAGNHDLEGKHSDRLGSAITALEGNCRVFNKFDLIYDLKAAVMPWHDSVADLKERLQKLPDYINGHSGCKARGITHDQVDLIIHAPINGVIMGIPDHGLEPQWLADLGFKRVFGGHYHNHKSFCDGKVFSIGALAHHTWSDVGSLAGFLIVHDDRVEHVESELPKFVDLEAGDTDHIGIKVKGNYVRAKLNSSKVEDLNAVRKLLEDAGAKGVTIVSVKQPVQTRTGATVQAGASIQQSVSDFIKTKTYARPDAVSMRAQKVLAEAEVM